MILYTDMVGDLYHYGHYFYLRHIAQNYKKNPDDVLFVGVHNDKDVESYKRTPVLNMEERINIIESCKYIDKIIPNAPVKLTKEYVDEHNIDLIFVPNNRTDDELKLMVSNIDIKRIRKIPYTDTISTTEIIQRIKERKDL